MPTYKLSVDKSFDDMLENCVKRTDGVNDKEAVIRNAVALYDFLHREVGEEPGRKSGNRQCGLKGREDHRTPAIRQTSGK